MYGRNSTIRVKQKFCASCGKPCYWFSKKRCQQCARIEDTMARMEQESDEVIKKEGLADLVKVADDVYSKQLRLSSADEHGNVKCYTCDQELRWQDAHCGHYLSRGNQLLRYDPRNTRVQCEGCNVHKDGNKAEYTKRLEAEHPGITEILKQEAALVYHPSRSELHGIINDCKRKLKQLKK